MAKCNQCLNVITIIFEGWLLIWLLLHYWSPHISGKQYFQCFCWLTDVYMIEHLSVIDFADGTLCFWDDKAKELINTLITAALSRAQRFSFYRLYTHFFTTLLIVLSLNMSLWESRFYTQILTCTEFFLCFARWTNHCSARNAVLGNNYINVVMLAP